MIPGKEHLVYFEKMVRRLKKEGHRFCVYLQPDEVIVAREHLQGLTNIYNTSINYIGRKSTTRMWSSVTKIFIPFEVESGLYFGAMLVLTYTFIPPEKHRLEVSLFRTTCPTTKKVYKNPSIRTPEKVRAKEI